MNKTIRYRNEQIVYALALNPQSSLRAQRSNPSSSPSGAMDCFVGFASSQ
ncbi:MULTISPECIES: hypothetical protein [unclassified Inquilinus]